MAKRYVIDVWTDDMGKITHLLNPGEIWSPLSKRAAMVDITAGIHEYFMEGSEAPIIVAPGSGKHLKIAEVSTSEEDLRR